MGSGCGAVGRGPLFESSHRQIIYTEHAFTVNSYKDENKQKEAGNGPSTYIFDDCNQWKRMQKVTKTNL